MNKKTRNLQRGVGAAGAKNLIQQMLAYLSMASKEGVRTRKTELLAMLFKGDYAYGLGALNALIALGYIEEIYSEDMPWVRVAVKGIRYASP